MPTQTAISASSGSDFPFWDVQQTEAPDLARGCLLLVDKPYGYSSFDVIRLLQRFPCNRKVRIGHAGTLDPLATGLLILATGRLTKEIDHFQGLPKQYTGRICLGYERSSHDLETPICSYVPPGELSDQTLETVRRSLTGELLLRPPLHSAIRTQGVRAYKLARGGSDHALEPRAMTVDQFEIDATHFPELAFEIRCSKGTYIRSIAAVFGERLGCGAYLSALRRTAIGPYPVNSAWSLDRLMDLSWPESQR
ncbi:MAG: tRNA pseudouridine(55) synthase TruB [Saprospiraceae bacterium]|nr:tRNA pseudouridine(55) synthase TruB [Saprospiraceae bacterium]